MSSPRAKQAQEAAAAAACTAAVAQARQRRAEARDAYEEKTQGLLFIKEFHDHNHALMQDPFETVATRVLAWARRYSWGEWSLFAIGVDGLPKHQVDCCRELCLKAPVVSKAVKYWQWRGYLEDQAKLIVPVISPAMGGPAPDADVKSPEWGAFCELWKVAHSAEFEELEVARATVDRIRKVRRAEYKKWREQETNARASLLEIAREGPGDPLGSKPLSPYEQSQRQHLIHQTPAKSGTEMVRMQSKARDFLFSEIARMQQAHPNSTFASPAMDPDNPDHQNLVNLILAAIGTNEDDLVGYVVWCASNFKGLGPVDSRKRAPGTLTGPKSLGLLVNWAKDYARVSGASSTPRVQKAGGDD